MKELIDQLTQFKDVAKADLRKGFPALRALYPRQRFYVLGLYSSALFGYIAPVGNSEEALADEEARWSPGIGSVACLTSTECRLRSRPWKNCSRCSSTATMTSSAAGGAR